MRLSTAALCLALAGVASADGLPDGIGVVTPNGSVFTTAITPDDTDDYVFSGYPGMVVKATVKTGRRSELGPILQILRPDGTAVSSAVALTRRPIAAGYAIDATGTWKVRVSGASGSTGEYSVKLAARRPPRVVRQSLAAPDGTGKYRFAIPAEGGATIGYTLRWTGDAPVFVSFVDPRGRLVAGFPGGRSVKSFTVPAGLPLGEYSLTLGAGAASGRVEIARTFVPRPAKRRIARLAAAEPVIQPDSVYPAFGSGGTQVMVGADGLVDPNAPDGLPGLLLGSTPLENVTVTSTFATLRGRVPMDLPGGVYDLVVTSTSGQPVVVPRGFECASTPVVTSMDPQMGVGVGGFDITLTGDHFRPGHMGVLVDGVFLPAPPTVLGSTILRFTAPAHAPGTVTIVVRDLDSGLETEVPAPLFEYVGYATIARVTPPLVPLLSTDPITVEGYYFSPTDKVFFETTTPGTFEEIAPSPSRSTTFNAHVFVPPLRPVGEYQIYVEDELGRPNPRKSKPVTVFSYADATAAAGLAAQGADPGDAETSTLADFDRDGDLDLVLSRRGGTAASTSSETRVLRNDGLGSFTDATAAVMPAATADDWRADRIVASDIDSDGFVDLVLATNSLNVPPAGRSHTRILMNEARGGSGAGAADRVFRDRTLDLMAPVRRVTTFSVAGKTPDPAREYVSDDWRGLDLWVGDLDGDGAGAKSIVIVHDETKTDNGVQSDGLAWGVMCGNYCVPPYTQTGGLALYWTGARAFRWDRSARGGQGRFQFEPIAFQTYIGNYVGTCALNPNYGSCPGTFTPMTGKRLAVGDVNDDGRKDVAVLSDHPVVVMGQWASALQVMLRGTLAPGYLTFDVDLTPKLSAFGYDLSGDTLAFGAAGFPDGNPYGTMAVAWAQQGAGRRLSLLQFAVDHGETSVEDVTFSALPVPESSDSFHAAQIAFRDVDADGREDLVLLAPDAPGGTRNAVRFLRNTTVSGRSGTFRRAFDAALEPVVSSTEHFEGNALAIGDVTGDGLLEYVVSRRSAAGGRPSTRILSTRK